jgi:hypothetical protein
MPLLYNLCHHGIPVVLVTNVQVANQTVVNKEIGTSVAQYKATNQHNEYVPIQTNYFNQQHQ